MSLMKVAVNLTTSKILWQTMGFERSLASSLLAPQEREATTILSFKGLTPKLPIWILWIFRMIFTQNVLIIQRWTRSILSLSHETIHCDGGNASSMLLATDTTGSCNWEVTTHLRCGGANAKHLLILRTQHRGTRNRTRTRRPRVLLLPSTTSTISLSTSKSTIKASGFFGPA